MKKNKQSAKKTNRKMFEQMFSNGLDYKSLNKEVEKREEKVWRQEGYDSPLERKFHIEAKKQGLVLEMQKPIGTYMLDFYVELGEHKIAIEIDGSKFHKTNDQITKDVKRQRSLQMMGFTVLRFSGTEVHKYCGACVRELKEYLSRLSKSNTT